MSSSVEIMFRGKHTKIVEIAEWLSDMGIPLLAADSRPVTLEKIKEISDVWIKKYNVMRYQTFFIPEEELILVKIKWGQHIFIGNP